MNEKSEQIFLNVHHYKSMSAFKAFINEEVVPFADIYDQREQLPRELLYKMASNGYLGSLIPKPYNVSELDIISFGLLCEEIGRASFSLMSLLTVHTMVAQVLVKWGSPWQQQHYLPKLAAAEYIAAFALSEPNIGSDPSSVETIATSTEDGFVLNGVKKWISGGQMADVFLILAQCEGKPTAFLIDKNTLGFSTKPITGMMGFRAAMLSELHFDHCKIPKANLVGGVGFGFSHVANFALDHGRYCIAWGSVGLSRACLEASLAYSHKRKQFGVYLKEHQLIQKMITDMMVETNAARLLCLQAGYSKSQNNPNSIMETSIAKYYASKTAVKAANDAVQIQGANGCSSESPVQRYFRDAKITEIIEGSSQIQQQMIAKYGYQNFF